MPRRPSLYHTQSHANPGFKIDGSNVAFRWWRCTLFNLSKQGQTQGVAQLDPKFSQAVLTCLLNQIPRGHNSIRRSAISIDDTASRTSVADGAVRATSAILISESEGSVFFAMSTLSLIRRVIPEVLVLSGWYQGCATSSSGAPSFITWPIKLTHVRSAQPDEVNLRLAITPPKPRAESPADGD